MIPKKSIHLPVARKRKLSSASASSGCSVASDSAVILSATLKDASVSVKPKISRSASSKTASKPVVVTAKSRQSLNPIMKLQRFIEPTVETKAPRSAICAQPVPSKSVGLLKVKPSAVKSSSNDCSDLTKQSAVKQTTKVTVKSDILKGCRK